MYFVGGAAGLRRRPGERTTETPRTQSEDTQRRQQTGQRQEAAGQGLTVLSWPVFLSVCLISVSSVTLWFVPLPHDAFQRSTGVLAARTSSGRLRPSVCGASCRKLASSSLIASRASAKASSVSLLSVSVGSIISASGTTSGK